MRSFFLLLRVTLALAMLSLAVSEPSRMAALASEAHQVTDLTATEMPGGMECCPEAVAMPDCDTTCPAAALCAAKCIAGPVAVAAGDHRFPESDASLRSSETTFRSTSIPPASQPPKRSVVLGA